MTASDEAAARLADQLGFVLEVDRLKSVIRRGFVADGSRRENTAEHSWTLALMALVLAEHAADPVDVATVVRMVVIHDLVEVDAGDTYVYDDADPLVGPSEPFGGCFTAPREGIRERYTGVPRFVTVKGGAYFFMPGLAALRSLSGASEPGTPRRPSARSAPRRSSPAVGARARSTSASAPGSGCRAAGAPAPSATGCT